MDLGVVNSHCVNHLSVTAHLVSVGRPASWEGAQPDLAFCTLSTVTPAHI